MNEPADTTDEPRELAKAMLRRGAARIELARDAFRRAYPEAPEQMISAAVFHVYVDGIEAVIHWLAETELFLRDPNHRLATGWSGELIHHVYNWHQLESLMPLGKTGVLKLLDEITQLAHEGEIEAVKGTAEEIKKLLTGDETAPDYK